MTKVYSKKSKKAKTEENKPVFEAGLSGHVYEVNLCTYLFLACTKRTDMKCILEKDKHIEEFYIAANMDKVDNLDDIAVKIYSTNDNDQKQELVSFIQAKHKSKNKKTLTIEHLINSKELRKYLEAYRIIKAEMLDNNNMDPIFSTPLDNLEIIYFTNANLLLDKKLDERKLTYQREGNSLMYFDESNQKPGQVSKNSFLKLNTEMSIKSNNIMGLMMLEDDKKLCESIVEVLIRAMNIPYQPADTAAYEVYLLLDKTILIVKSTGAAFIPVKKESLLPSEKDSKPEEKEQYLHYINEKLNKEDNLIIFKQILLYEIINIELSAGERQCKSPFDNCFKNKLTKEDILEYFKPSLYNAFILIDKPDVGQFTSESKQGEYKSLFQKDLIVRLNDKEVLNIFAQPLLDEIIDIERPGVGTFKLRSKEDCLSPFQICFEKKRASATITDITLPHDFGDKSMLQPINLYTKEYFEEFFKVFKIFFNQPDVTELKRLVVEMMRNTLPIDESSANDYSIVITSEILTWWQDKSKRVRFLDKNSPIIKDTVDFSLRYNVKVSIKSFTGRKTKLEELHNLIAENERSLVRVVHGLGGVGKTEFVRRYIEICSKFYEHKVIWIDAENTDSIFDSFVKLAKSKLSFIKTDDEKPENIIKNTFQYFSDKICLIVFDNAENYSDLENILAITKSLKIWKPYIIITSRNSEWEPSIKKMKLAELEVTEAIDLIKTGLQIDIDEDMEQNSPLVMKHSEQDITELAKTLHCFPLALQQAISYIYYELNISVYSIADYIHDYNENEAKFLNLKGKIEMYDDYQSTTLQTWLLTKEKIKSNQSCGAIAILVLKMIAYCAPNNILSEMFFELPDVTEAKVKEAIHLLISYSMLNDDNEDETRLSVHRLVQTVTRIETQQDSELNHIIMYNCLLIFDRKLNKANLDHCLATWKYAIDQEKLLKCFGHMFRLILDLMFEESRYQEAFSFASKILDELPKWFGKNHNNILDVKCEMARLLFRLSKFEQALEMYDGVLQDIPTGNMEKQLKVKCVKGKMLRKMNKFDEALEILREVEQESAEHLPPGHAVVTHAKEDIARIHKRNGHYSDALRMFQEGLEILEKERELLKDKFDIVRILTVKSDIASCYKYLGRYQESIDLFQQVLDEKLEKYDEKSATVLRTLNNMSVVFTKQGKYLESLDILNKSLSIKKSIYGETSSSTLVTKHNIGALYLHLPADKYEEGLTILYETAKESINVRSLHHKSTIDSFEKMAKLMHLMGRYEEAMSTHELCYNTSLSLFKDKEHPQVLDIRINIAQTLAAQGHKDRALAIIEEVLDIRLKNKNFGEQHPDTLTSLYEKADVLSAMGNFDAALRILHDIEKKVREKLGCQHLLYKKTVGAVQKIDQARHRRCTTKSFISTFIKQTVFLLILANAFDYMFTYYFYNT